jgi:hypothetical protein
MHRLHDIQQTYHPGLPALLGELALVTTAQLLLFVTRVFRYQASLKNSFVRPFIVLTETKSIMCTQGFGV